MAGRVAEDAPDLKTVGGRLRWARIERKYASARSAAELNRWNENTYKSHEQGLRRKDGLPTETAKKYAKAFRISVAWLLTGDGDPFNDRADDYTDEEIAVIEALRAARGR